MSYLAWIQTIWNHNQKINKNYSCKSSYLSNRMDIYICLLENLKTKIFLNRTSQFLCWKGTAHLCKANFCLQSANFPNKRNSILDHENCWTQVLIKTDNGITAPLVKERSPNLIDKSLRSEYLKHLMYTRFLSYRLLLRPSLGKILKTDMGLKHEWHKTRWNGNKQHEDGLRTDRDKAYSTKQEKTIFEIISD